MGRRVRRAGNLAGLAWTALTASWFPRGTPTEPQGAGRQGYPGLMRSPRAMAIASVSIDALSVLAFVIIGRASHHEGGGLAGLANTAWPFLAGLAAGELATRCWRRPAALWPTGTGVWLSTVALGMILRVLAGQGTAAAFIAVALAFLGLFLLGWRGIAALLGSRSGATGGQPGPARSRR